MNQKQRVVKYIQDYGSITALDAMRDLGIQQLGERIIYHRFRRMKW